MDPFTGALIGAGAGIIGGIFNNQANAREARKNRAFQSEMSSTAHVREVADLKAAGLNPILSANAGASSPGGSQAQQENVASGLSSTASQAYQLHLAAKKQAQEIELLKAQTRNTDMDTRAKKLGAEKGDLAETIMKTTTNIGTKAKKHIQEKNWINGTDKGPSWDAPVQNFNYNRKLP